MAVNENIRKKLPKDALVFDSIAYDNSIIGVTIDNRVVYDYDLMIKELINEESINDEGWSYEEVIDWIDYTIIKTVPYLGESAPIIMYSIKKG